jgi:4-carboxymuconolactone decarboxylase
MTTAGSGTTPSELTLPKPAVMQQFCQQSDAEPDDAIYTKAVDKIGEQGVMDLIAVNGYYDVVSMTLNVARVAPPAGDEFPFKQAGR